MAWSMTGRGTTMSSMRRRCAAGSRSITRREKVGLVGAEGRVPVELERDHLIEIAFGCQRQVDEGAQRPLRVEPQAGRCAATELSDEPVLAQQRGDAMMGLALAEQVDASEGLHLLTGLQAERGLALAEEDHQRIRHRRQASAQALGHESRQLAGPPAEQALQQGRNRRKPRRHGRTCRAGMRRRPKHSIGIRRVFTVAIIALF